MFTNSKIIAEDINATTRQLSKVITHCEDLLVKEPCKDFEAYRHDSRRFLVRFEEIIHNNERMIASYRVNIDAAVLSSEMVRDTTHHGGVTKC